jgi:hypothetical protein
MSAEKKDSSRSTPRGRVEARANALMVPAKTSEARLASACLPCANCPSCQSVAIRRHYYSQISGRFRRIPPRQQGRTRRHGRWAGCGGRGWQRATNDANADGQGVWSWHPDAGVKLAMMLRIASHRADDGGNKARSPRRARYTPLKPLRGECRVNRCDRGDYARMLILFCMRDCGCIERPAFPAPFAQRAEGSSAKLARFARRDRRGAW